MFILQLHFPLKILKINREKEDKNIILQAIACAWHLIYMNEKIIFSGAKKKKKKDENSIETLSKGYFSPLHTKYTPHFAIHSDIYLD